MPATPTHCVFSRGRHQLAVPAVRVREVLPAPAMISLPHTPIVFSGLCHLRSEFIPVLNIDSFLNHGRNARDEFLLLIEDSDCVWALIVDKVHSLLPLEISDAPESDDANRDSVIVGWATHEESVIQILDPGRVRELAERQLVGSLPNLDLPRNMDSSREPVSV